MSTVVILEDWVEKDGDVYYRWRTPEATTWNYILTPYKHKPIVHYKYLNHLEFDDLLERTAAQSKPNDKEER